MDNPDLGSRIRERVKLIISGGPVVISDLPITPGSLTRSTETMMFLQMKQASSSFVAPDRLSLQSQRLLKTADPKDSTWFESGWRILLARTDSADHRKLYRLLPVVQLLMSFMAISGCKP